MGIAAKGSCAFRRAESGNHRNGLMRLNTHLHARRTPRPHCGSVLLEVVLALTLFATAAVIIGGGLNASVNSAERLRQQAHAADLAITVMSELQMGVRSPAQPGPEAFPAPFTNWTWEVVSTPIEAAPESQQFATIEVVIRLTESGLVYRLGQILPLNAGAEKGER